MIWVCRYSPPGSFTPWIRGIGVKLGVNLRKCGSKWCHILIVLSSISSCAFHTAQCIVLSCGQNTTLICCVNLFALGFKLYCTAHHVWCVHLKSASYKCTCPGALRPFKCSVHSCRGLELWPHSLSPHYIMVCGQIDALATLPSKVHMHLMNSKFLASL
jgi:hypothetical protein